MKTEFENDSTVKHLKEAFIISLPETRIEALRAASRIVAGITSRDDADLKARLDLMTINIAEQFAKWLETGER